MDVIIENLPLYWNGFLRTLFLSAVSGIIALVLGTLLAAARVSPVAALRGFSTVYVEVVRNTPLTIAFFFAAIVLPRLGVKFEQFEVAAIIALSAYTAAFIAEAVRSGVNSVPVGQAEAARSIGMNFGQVSEPHHPSAGVPDGDPAADQHPDRPRQELLSGRRLLRPGAVRLRQAAGQRPW
jgi:glutamate transport system permease protein